MRRGSVGLTFAIAVPTAVVAMVIYSFVLIARDSSNLNEVFTSVAIVFAVFAVAVWAALAVLVAVGVGRGLRAIRESAKVELVGRGVGAVVAACVGFYILRSLFSSNPLVSIIVVLTLSILAVVVVPNVIGRPIPQVGDPDTASGDSLAR